MNPDQFPYAYADAVLSKDARAFLALYAEDVVVFDTWEEWTYAGHAAWSRVVKSWFDGLGDDRVKVRFTPVLSKVDGDTAIFCATVRYAALNAAGEELRSMENRLSWALKRGEDGWRIIHEHTSAPADGSTLQIKLQRP